MMKLRLSVRPRMKANGATSMVPRSRRRCAPSGPSRSYEGVVERTQIGVDLRHDVAGQEPETLSRFHRRPGEDDAVRVTRLERLHRQRHGQVRLAGAGGADAEGHDVGGDGVGVALLPRRLGSDGPTPRRAQQLGGEDLRRAHVVLDHGDGSADVTGVEALALFEQRDELVEQPTHPFGVFAVDGDLVAPHDDARPVERALGSAAAVRLSARAGPP